MAKQFGGRSWTVKKLDIVQAYLESYLKVMENHRGRLKLVYIDAFAGDGAIRMDSGEGADLVIGSAGRALSLTPGFDTYVFIDTDQRALDKLENLAKQAGRHQDSRFLRRDANEVLKGLADRGWSRHRAVVFMDPFGMQVEWATLEALARTGACDVWLWFPLGQAVMRLLMRKGNLPRDWENRLTVFFGEEAWKQAFYTDDQQHNLFGEDRGLVRSAGRREVTAYFKRRLKTIFPWVAEPGWLCNSTGNPLFLLWFASANPSPKAGRIALRIAGHLLKDQQR